MHKVLKPFPFSPDGIKTEMLEEGIKRIFPPELVKGLTDAGFIGSPDDDAKGDAGGGRGAKRAAEG